jgi:hypothetical protein
LPRKHQTSDRYREPAPFVLLFLESHMSDRELRELRVMLDMCEWNKEENVLRVKASAIPDYPKYNDLYNRTTLKAYDSILPKRIRIKSHKTDKVVVFSYLPLKTKTPPTVIPVVGESKYACFNDWLLLSGMITYTPQTFIWSVNRLIVEIDR